VQLEGNGAAAMTRLRLLRLALLMVTMGTLDALCVAAFGYVISAEGRSVLILFAFEYVVMGLEVVRCLYRYLIFLVGRTFQ